MDSEQTFQMQEVELTSDEVCLCQRSAASATFVRLMAPSQMSDTLVQRVYGAGSWMYLSLDAVTRLNYQCINASVLFIAEPGRFVVAPTAAEGRTTPEASTLQDQA